MIYHVLLQSDIIENEPHEHVRGVFSRLPLAERAAKGMLSKDAQRSTILTVDTSSDKEDWVASHYYWEDV